MVKGHETEADGHQFRLYNRKHFILKVQKAGNGAKLEKNDMIFTKFKEWIITHTWARESSNIYKKQSTLIWNSILYYQVHYNIIINRFNMHIVHTYIHANRYFATTKGYCSKKYFLVPLWDMSVTNSWGMAYSIWLFFFSRQINAVFIMYSIQDWV